MNTTSSADLKTTKHVLAWNLGKVNAKLDVSLYLVVRAIADSLDLASLHYLLYLELSAAGHGRNSGDFTAFGSSRVTLRKPLTTLAGQYTSECRGVDDQCSAGSFCFLFMSLPIRYSLSASGQPSPESGLLLGRQRPTIRDSAVWNCALRSRFQTGQDSQSFRRCHISSSKLQNRSQESCDIGSTYVGISTEEVVQEVVCRGGRTDHRA